MKAEGILGEDGLFRITLPPHSGVLRRDHSWRHDWILQVIAARRKIEEEGWEIIAPVDFATNHPGKENAIGGSVVVKSYESGGEILRFENGDWIIVGRQPEVVH